MSFRGDDQRRYGHMPPVQYPVASQQSSAADQLSRAQPPPRRSSYNNGDDATFFNTNGDQHPYRPTLDTGYAAQGDGTGGARESGAGDELCLSNNLAAAAMSSFQQQYPAPTPPTPSTAYNPQAFASHQQAQGSPRHHQSATANRYAAQSTATYSSTSAASYTPAPYNPAAYTDAAAVAQRDPTYAGAEYGIYGNQDAYSSPSTAQSGYWQPQPTYAPAQPSTTATHRAIASALYPSHDQSPVTHAYDSAPPYTQYPSQATYVDATTPPPTSYSPVPSQVPYPTYTSMPVGPNYSAQDPHAFLNQTSSPGMTRNGTQSSPLPPPPMQRPPPGGLQRHPTHAPLPTRPAGNRALDQWSPDGDQHPNLAHDYATQESIMQQIEAELAGATASHSGRQRNGDGRDDGGNDLHRRNSSASYGSTSSTINGPGGSSSGLHRYSSNASTLRRDPYAYDDDESDPEAEAGLMAMQQADEDDRHFSNAVSFPYFSQPDVAVQSTLHDLAEEPGSDSDYAAMDLGLFSGGYAGHLQYDNNPVSPDQDVAGSQAQPSGMPGSGMPGRNHASQRSQRSQRSQGSTQYPAFEEATIDYGGTGGLQAPSAQRLSFDQGQERVCLDLRQGSDSPVKDDFLDMPDMFYHPGLSSRPLPAIPRTSSQSSSLTSARSPTYSTQPAYSTSVDAAPYTGPDAQYGQNAQQLQVERSISLLNHSTAPLVQPMARSITDAEDRGRRHVRQQLQLQQQQQQQQQRLAAQQEFPPESPYEAYDSGTASSITYDVITLPTGRRRKFVPDKLTKIDVDSCKEPWALTAISNWLRDIAEGEPDLKRKTVEDGLVRLFCLKVPTIKVAEAEALSAHVVDSMLGAGILVPEEEWLKFGPGAISGVLWQITGSGCYSRMHEKDEGESPTARCYSHYCGRTLKKASLDDLTYDGSESRPWDISWIDFWGFADKDAASAIKGRKEVERQSNLHELVVSEERFLYDVETLLVLYRDQILHSKPPVIAEGRLEKFVAAVFGKVEALAQINRDHLLAQLKYRQKEQGPWVVGFSDIYREWTRKVRKAFVECVAGFPYANYLFKREMERNYMFKQLVDSIRLHPRSGRLDWTNYLKVPTTRLTRYPLLLSACLHNTVAESEEKTNLSKAVGEVQAIAEEGNHRVDEQTKKVALAELGSMLKLRTGFKVDLNLDQMGRKLLIEGDLQRMGSKGVRWVDTHAILLDHYLILAKLSVSKDGRQERKYDVSREPIPMPLLFLESSHDDPVSKQKGIATPLTRTAASASEVNLRRAVTSVERPSLEHSATASVTKLQYASTENDGKILYPFRIKHLGHEIYTLFATSLELRQTWCDKIIEAKTRHAKGLQEQNAEPFRLRVMADSAFAYDQYSNFGKYVGGVHIRSTPLDRAIRELEQTVGPGRGPPPISRATVHCAVGFWAFGRQMVAVGTDVGVFVAEASQRRGWSKVCKSEGQGRSVKLRHKTKANEQQTATANRVVQIAVLEEFSVVLILADRNLISYPLDVIAPPANYPAPPSDNPRRSPQKLAKDVSFFAIARMKDRMLVFFKKKEGLHSTFKVLEPVFQKATERRTRLFTSSRRGAGNTDTFRDYDDFYLPVECYSINLFQSYIAIATAKGFELMTLDKKVPMSLPDVKEPTIGDIAGRIRDQRPLGMFRLNDSEFLLAYEDCAVYVDKHGEVSRSVIMEYSGKQKRAKSATMFGQYLLLFNDAYVEVRNAENGRLRQIVAGRDVHVLDYGIRGPTGGFYQSSSGYGHGAIEGVAHSKGTVKICMAHPEITGQQILLELLLNSGHSEK